MRQFISLPLKIEVISDTNAQLIQNAPQSLVTIKIKKEREKKPERKKGKNNRSRD